MIKFFGSGTPALQPKDFVFRGTTPLDVRYVAGAIDTAALNTGQIAKDTLVAMRFFAPIDGGVIDEIGFTLTTLQANTSARIGLYEATSTRNPYPGSLISGSASLDTTASQVQKTHNPAAALRPGWMYWLAYVCGGAGTAPTIRTGSVNSWAGDLGIIIAANQIPTTPNIGLTVAYAIAALPSTFPAGATPLLATPIPVLTYHFA